MFLIADDTSCCCMAEPKSKKAKLNKKTAESPVRKAKAAVAKADKSTAAAKGWILCIYAWRLAQNVLWVIRFVVISICFLFQKFEVSKNKKHKKLRFN